jgi:hypothetical protein
MRNAIRLALLSTILPAGVCYAQSSTPLVDVGPGVKMAILRHLATRAPFHCHGVRILHSMQLEREEDPPNHDQREIGARSSFTAYLRWPDGEADQ